MVFRPFQSTKYLVDCFDWTAWPCVSLTAEPTLSPFWDYALRTCLADLCYHVLDLYMPSTHLTSVLLGSLANFCILDPTRERGHSVALGACMAMQGRPMPQEADGNYLFVTQADGFLQTNLRARLPSRGKRRATQGSAESRRGGGSRGGACCWVVSSGYLNLYLIVSWQV